MLRLESLPRISNAAASSNYYFTATLLYTLLIKQILADKLKGRSGVVSLFLQFEGSLVDRIRTASSSWDKTFATIKQAFLDKQDLVPLIQKLDDSMSKAGEAFSKEESSLFNTHPCLFPKDLDAVRKVFTQNYELSLKTKAKSSPLWMFRRVLNIFSFFSERILDTLAHHSCFVSDDGGSTT
uniref:Uncharacterized protein n=1 Tax=Strombidium inclinatum TaxID=197538 RepID=A0A7S3IVC5_9SPIT|mmetsp:Transcript_4411/g.6443  ORF Transcript_4411/g.6443 Transcript_4411/m.6443 type:complete len:182 (+) Transcript_4411:3098-3643(+)